MFGKIKAFAETKIKLATMGLKEKLAKVVAKLIPIVILIFLGLFFIIFLSVTGGLLLNDILESPWLGFAIVSGIYLLLFLIFLLIQNTAWFKNLILNKILNAINSSND